MGRKIVVKRPDGSSLVVDENDAKSLSKLGYTPESTEEAAGRITQAANEEYFSGIGQKALTAVEGFGAGATLGLTDFGATDESRASAQYNPGVRVVSELVGAIAPAIATGGASTEASAGRLAAREALSLTPAGIVARGGRAIEGAIGGTKGAIAAGAFEGTVGGMGAAITQAKLNDDPLTIESVFSSGGIGGLIGGGVGGVASRLGKVKPAVERLEDAADNVVSVASREADTLDEFYKSLPKDKVDNAPMWKDVPQDKPYAVERVTDNVEEAVFQPVESFGSVRKSLDTPIKNINDAVVDLDKQLADANTAFSSIREEIPNIQDSLSAGGRLPEFKTNAKSLASSFDSGDPDKIESSIADYFSNIEKHVGGPVDRTKITNDLAEHRKLLKKADKISAKMDDSLKDLVEKGTLFVDKSSTVKGLKSVELKFYGKQVKQALARGDVAAFEEAFAKYTGKLESTLGQKLPVEMTSDIATSLKKYNKHLGDSEALTTETEKLLKKVRKNTENTINKYTTAGNAAQENIDKLQYPYQKLQKAIKAKNIDEIDAIFKEYSATAKAVGAFDESVVTENIKKYKVASDRAKELVRLKEAASILKDFPDKVDDFRKLKAAKAEKLFAALDVVGENPEYAAITRDLDTTLEHMGISADGSAGNKARTIWESSKSPGFFKNENRAVQRARLNMEPSVDENVLKSELGGMSGPTSGKNPTEYRDLISNDPAEKLVAKQNPTNMLGEPTLDLSNISLEDINLKDINTGDVMASDMVRTGVPKKKVHGFWKRAAESAGRRVSSSMARKIGLGALGSAVAFEAGGSATDMLIGGMFGSTVAGSRTSTVGRISAAARKAAPAIGKGLGKTYGAFGRLTTRLDGTEDSKSDAKARIEEVNNFVPTARDKAFSAVEDLAMDHPEFTKAFIDTVDNFAKTLQSLLPKDPGLAFSSGKSLWDLDPVQKIQTGKVFAVAHDPVSTAEYIASGNADMFTIKAYKALWPAQQQEFVVGVLDALTSSGKINDMSYEEQNYYSTVTGVPFHSSMSPRSMAQTQAVYAAAGERERSKKGEMGGQTQKGGRPAKTEPPTTGQSLLA